MDEQFDVLDDVLLSIDILTILFAGGQSSFGCCTCGIA
jgi:hypothetical protein